MLNAHTSPLFAAAPEMLKILQVIMDGDDGEPKNWGLVYIDGDIRETEKLYERIRKVIAQAQGQPIVQAKEHKN
jgi:hypothetical protein